MNPKLVKGKRHSNKFIAKQLNEWIYAIVKENPKVTLQEISNEIGRTRERVRQLINDSHKDNNLKPIDRIKRRGGTNPDTQDLCVGGCGKSQYKAIRRYNQSEYVCNDCRKQRWANLKFNCSNCGKEFTVSEGYKYHRAGYKRKAKYPDLSFCSKVCLGTYSGRNFGFGANRKNINRG